MCCIVCLSWNMCGYNIERQNSVKNITKDGGTDFAWKNCVKFLLFLSIMTGLVKPPDIFCKMIQCKKRYKKFLVINGECELWACEQR